MKYIRTKDKIIEKNYKCFVDNTCDESFKSCNGIYYLSPKDIIKEANTIEDLCDMFIVKKKNKNLPIATPMEEIFDEEVGITTPTFKDYIVWLFTQASNLEYVVLAIWTDVEKGNPILKTVARANKNGEIKLFYETN